MLLFPWIQSLRRAFGTPFLLLVFAVYWTQGFRSFPWTGINVLVKDELNLGPAAAQLMTSTAYIPWSVKPIYGIISDCIPIKGQRRVPYIVISNILTVVPWVVLATVKAITASPPIFTVMLVCQNIGAAMADVVVDAMVAESTNKERESFAGDLQALSWFSMAIGGVMGSLLGGPALQLLKPQGMFALFALFPLGQLVLCLLTNEQSLISDSLGKAGRQEEEQMGSEGEEEIKCVDSQERMNADYVVKEPICDEVPLLLQLPQEQCEVADSIPSSSSLCHKEVDAAPCENRSEVPGIDVLQGHANGSLESLEVHLPDAAAIATRTTTVAATMSVGSSHSDPDDDEEVIKHILSLPREHTGAVGSATSESAGHRENTGDVGRPEMYVAVPSVEEGVESPAELVLMPEMPLTFVAATSEVPGQRENTGSAAALVLMPEMRPDSDTGLRRRSVVRRGSDLDLQGAVGPDSGKARESEDEDTSKMRRKGGEPLHLWRKMVLVAMTLWEAVLNPDIHRPMLWFMASCAIVPSLQTTMFYYQTNYLKLDVSFLGTARVVGWGGLMLGTLIYNSHLKYVPMRVIFRWVHVILALLTLSDTVLTSRLNLHLGIPDKVFVLGASALSDAINQFKFMPFLILSARLCPPGIEGTLFALFMSAYNFGNTLSGYVGATLASNLGITSSSFDNMTTAVAIQAACTLIPITLLSFVPAHVSGAGEEKHTVREVKVVRSPNNGSSSNGSEDETPS